MHELAQARQSFPRLTVSYSIARMDNLERAKVSLLINGDDLDPSEVSGLLGMEPELGVRKDEQFVGGHGKPMNARTGMWHLSFGYESDAHLDRQIEFLLGQLSPNRSVWKYLTERFQCYLAIGAHLDGWTGGMTLSPETLMLLAERNLSIDFDLYAPDASD